MNYLVLDTETAAWAPGFVGVPTFAAAGFATGMTGGVDLTQDLPAARLRVQEALARGDVVVGHNLAFDLDVLGVVPAPDHRVWDTMIMDILERLSKEDCWNDLGAPRPCSLEKLAGRTMEGKDSVRLSFLPGHPMSPEQQKYLTSDVQTTKQVFLRQLERVRDRWLPELLLQVRAQLALNKIERTGIPVDDVAIIHQEREYGQLRREAAITLKEAGVWAPASVGPRGGKRKEKVCMKEFRDHVEKILNEADEEPILTDKGALKTDKQVLTQLTHDPVVKAWLVYKSCEKLLSTYLRAWKGAGVVHARYRLMMRTGRTSSHSPNLQQVPSRGDKANIKKVFVAPPGRVFYELDYSQLELCCLAYLTQGEMLRRINAGEDLHRYLATVYFGKPADQVTKDERQLMKCANFGLPGGMGPKKFRTFIRQSGLPDPGHEASVALRNAWLAAYPEMARWLDDPEGEHWERLTRQIWSGRDDVPASEEDRDAAWALAERRLEDTGSRIPGAVRAGLWKQVQSGVGSRMLETWLVGRRAVVDGGRSRWPVTYTEQHNTRFQGLAANLTKHALSLVTLADQPWQVHAFIHDSVLISVAEAPDDARPAVLCADLMLQAATRWLPGVHCEVEVAGPGHTWFEAKRAPSIKCGTYGKRSNA